MILLAVLLLGISSSWARYLNDNDKGIYNLNADYLNKFPYNYRYPNEALPKQVAPDYPQDSYKGYQPSYQHQVAPPAPSYQQPSYQPQYQQYQQHQPSYNQQYQPSYNQQHQAYQVYQYQPPSHTQAYQEFQKLYQPAQVYQPAQQVYQPAQQVYQPPPPPPAPAQTSPPPPPELHYKGKFSGTCSDLEDGLYYVDHRSFAYCSNNNKAMQNCAEGSANPEFDDFESGKYTKVTDFCSVNIAAVEISKNRQ